MDMDLRLDDAEAAALRDRATREGRSMEEVARVAIAEYVEKHRHDDLLNLAELVMAVASGELDAPSGIQDELAGRSVPGRAVTAGLSASVAH